MSKVFGKNPSGERLKRIQKSPNYRDGAFQNINPTTVTSGDVSMGKMLKDFINRPSLTNPPKDIPFVKTDLKNLEAETPAIIWFGHSSYFIKSKDFTILVDPVFSGHASPFKTMVKAFKGANEYQPDDFPEIDLLIITHDHFDHLDYKTVKELKHKVKHILTPLGVGSHLEYWNFPPNIITETDWWNSYSIAKDVTLTATPSRHFSGRTLKRAQTLWSSYVLNIHGYKIFIGGDSGYDDQFKKIGSLHGPFDIALLDGAQYGEGWPYIHMVPEQTVQAAQDLGTKILWPVHWSKFVLANHNWNEPVQRIVKAATAAQQKYVTPKIGEPYSIGEDVKKNEWWDF